MNDWVKMLGDWFSKLPPLPKSATDLLVSLAPWIALIFGILGVLGSIAAAGFLTALSPFMVLGGGMTLAAGGIVGSILLLASSVLMLVAFPGLKARKAQGWMMLFWSQVVSIVASLVSLNLVGAVLSFAIGFYILFQVKSYYK